jgi:hypothetical protein
MDNYEYISGVVTLVRVVICVQALKYSEKKESSVSVLENGKWVDKEPILGRE